MWKYGFYSICSDFETRAVALESYFDANVHLGYRINDQWSVYAKANNIANQDADYSDKVLLELILRISINRISSNQNL